MSVVMLDEYKTKLHRQEVLNERSKILEIASRKAQERTLTLQETTDLFAKFNSTYETSYKKQDIKEDESWALKLIQESVEETLQGTSLNSKINGEAIEPRKLTATARKPDLAKIRSLRLQPSLNDEAIFVDEKPKLRDAFLYEQFTLNDIPEHRRGKAGNQSLATVLALSVFITSAALIGIALFV